MDAGRDPGRQRSLLREEGRHRSLRPEWRRLDRQRPWEGAGTAGQQRGL